MPEINLGIGRSQQRVAGIEQEILAWFDAQGGAYLIPDETRERLRVEQQRAESEFQRAEMEFQRAEQERQRAEQLAQRLRSLGVDPDNL